MDTPVNMVVRVVGFSLALPGWLGIWIAGMVTHSYLHGGFAKLALIGLPFNFFFYTWARWEVITSRG
jgi:hypothetical protein